MNLQTQRRFQNWWS